MNSENQELSVNQEVTERDPPRDQDMFLTRLVEYSFAGLEIPVTLWVKGRLVTGILTSGKNFFEHALISLNLDGEQSEGSNGEIMAQEFGEWVELYSNPREHAPEWLHLKGAKTVREDGRMIPYEGGLFWRGRIAAIDGFCLGQMAAKE